MTPRQIIAQFKMTLTEMAGDASAGIFEREQQRAGALALASRLIRFHPQLSAKGDARSYLAELNQLMAGEKHDKPRVSSSKTNGTNLA